MGGAIYESTPGSAAASLVVATDTRKAARQVGEILKARNAEREKIFSGVLALAAYIAAGEWSSFSLRWPRTFSGCS